MEPVLSNISHENEAYKFTLSGLNVSLANALRRTILSEIPTICFYTETYQDSQCNIQVNTTRLHNEILKHRLSCIPVHEPVNLKQRDNTLLVGTHVLELDMKNETDSMIIVTTEHFRVKNKTSGKYLVPDEVRRIFPANKKTNMFIDFARLRPKIGDSIPGEQLTLTAEFSIHSAKENSMFNVVSKCAYGNTIDTTRVNAVWSEQDATLRSQGVSDEDIEFQKKNFYLLDAQRHFVEDSFDFVVETVGVYENKDIVKMAALVLVNKLTDFIQNLESDSVPMLTSETTIEHCYDVTLENEDYTLGKILEYILYEKFYIKDKTLTYCGFKKFHPHNADSVLRMAYTQKSDRRMVAQYLKEAATSAKDVYVKLYGMF
jgi:DNA-directed RNA polymerase subunit L